MSKKCCGFIYSDEDQVCRICGNPLVDDDFMSGGTGHMSDMDILLSSLSDKTDDYDEYSEQDNATELYNGDKVMDEVEEDILTEVSETQMPESEIPLENEINKMDILDEIEAEEQAAEDAKIKPGEEKAPISIKVVGILSMVLAGMALVMSGVFVYFMVIKPSYDKSGEAMKPIYFPEIATGTDIELSEPRGYITNVPLATSTDYTVYEPVEPESSETDSAETDATATDAGETPAADVVE